MAGIRSVASWVLMFFAVVLALPATLLMFAAEKLSDYADDLIE
jgi:hypothetical protein